jgi:hypothetical protein
MREHSTETQETLPWRLRIFEKFPNQPQMITLNRLPSEFSVPKIRESFMKQFLGDDYFDDLHKANKQQANNKKDNLETDGPSSGANQLRFTKGKNLEIISENDGNTELYGFFDVENLKASFSRHKYDETRKVPLLKRLNDNLRLQRAYRDDMKKAMLLTNIIASSNNQRSLTMDSANQNGPSTAMLSGDHFKRTHVNKNMLKNNMLHNGSSTHGKINLLNRSNLQSFNNSVHTDIDFKMYQFKKQQAELKRNQLEEDLKENHPFFDKPLFTIGRESNIRNLCKIIVEARYHKKNLTRIPLVFMKKQYKQIHKFFGLVTYLDWIMISITITSCISIAFESPHERIYDNWKLQVAEYLFVISMSIEIILKSCAYGFLFTPNALLKDFGGFLDLFIYLISLIFLIVMPNEVETNSGAQMLLLLRCFRPLRIFTLVPHMRKVIYELCRGFKEIMLVTILLVVLIFIFANYGIQIYGGKLARCNDVRIHTKKDCVGLYRRNLFVSKLKLDNKTIPSIWVPRVWSNPYNFNFDTIGNSMLALFEVLSLEGWLEVRDVIIDRMGSVSDVLLISAT